MELQVQHSTDLAGYWRIVALGGLIKAPDGASDPFVRLFVRRLKSQSGRLSKDTLGLEPWLTHVDIPLGETHRLATGVILKDNAVVEQRAPDLEEFEIEVEFQDARALVQQRSRFVGHEGKSLFQADLSPEHTRQLNELLVLCSTTTDGTTRYVVPCHEIYRFYYFPSSRMGRCVTSYRILQPETLYSAELTEGLDAQGRMHIVVRRSLLRSDVPIFANWLANGYGLRGAQGVAHHVHGGGILTSVIPVRALPPFKGKTRWKVLGRWVDSPSGRLLIVYQLLTCYAPFSYQSLDWRYDNEPQVPLPSKDDPQEPQKKTPPPAVFVPFDIPNFVHISGKDRSKGRITSWCIPQDDLATRFPGLNLQDVKHVHPPPEEARSRKRRPQNVPIDPTGYSARPPNSAGGDGIQQIEFTTSNPKIVSDVDAADVGRDFDLVSPTAAMEYMFEICVAMEERGCTWIDRVDQGEAELWNEHLFNVLPQNIEGKKRPFLYLDKDLTRRRPVYIGEFERGGRFGYLLDIVRATPKEDFCMLLFRANDYARVSEVVLRSMLEICATKRRANVPSEVAEGLGIECRRFLHLFGKPVDARALDAMAILCLDEPNSSYA